MVPKRALNVLSCEVTRLLQLTQNAIIPISYHIQRKVLHLLLLLLLLLLSSKMTALFSIRVILSFMRTCFLPLKEELLPWLQKNGEMVETVKWVLFFKNEFSFEIRELVVKFLFHLPQRCNSLGGISKLGTL